MRIYQQAPYILVKDRLIDPSTGAVDFVNRFFGTGIARTIGIDLTRRTFRETYTSDAADTFVGFFDQVANGITPVYADGTCCLADNDPLTYVGLYLPLLDDQDQPAHVMSIIDFTMG